ncbi:MAG: alpha/beta hydrolase [Kiritimatiellales bacterium]|nr:alpha/beta hydrolase [Kiritimatiellales bacterium]
MRRSSIILFCLVCTALLLNGCVFRLLKEDLARIDELKPISGVVINEAAHPKPIMVILWALDDGPEEASGYWVVHQDGAFQFLRPSGRYYLFAFEDTNEDFKYQDNEFAAAYGTPSLIDLDSGEGYQNLELRLLPPGQIKTPPSILAMSSEEQKEKFAWRKGRTGIVTTMDSPLFTQENGDVGLWQPYTFAQQFGINIFFLEPYDPRKIPVLFVHGASGHPGLWKEIVANMDREHYQPWLTFYPSGLRLNQISDVLAKYMEELRLKYQFSDLVVVAHSMGGLVSRSMIQTCGEHGNRCALPLYVTIATPWQGHELASMGIKRAPAVVPAWYDIVPGSPFIKEMFSKPLPAETFYYLFFAHQGNPWRQLTPDNTDGAVSLKSQLSMQAQDEASRVIGIDATHVSILSNTNVITQLNQLLEQHRRK